MSNYYKIKEMFEREIFCRSFDTEDLLNSSPDLLYKVENLEDEDGEWRKIFEVWKVSKFLYDELREWGVPVLKFNGSCYWGRTTTGQSIYSDGFLGKLYKKRMAK